MTGPRGGMLIVALVVLGGATLAVPAEQPAAAPRAFIDGTGPDWKPLTGDDFVTVNGDDDTWVWKGAELHCKGTPVGVCRTKQQYTNFELVAEWRHLESAGNSGIFVWASEEGLKDLKPGKLPGAGIEVQILDHGYAEKMIKAGKKTDFFTTNGDVFNVGKSKMTPFPPTSPNGKRSFPRKNLSKGVNEWNHYYVRAINGELRLWVNGEEVSGGKDCDPRRGYLCLEAEGAPIDFRNLRIRVLP
jgi:hypothetical protein